MAELTSTALLAPARRTAVIRRDVRFHFRHRPSRKIIEHRPFDHSASNRDGRYLPAVALAVAVVALAVVLAVGVVAVAVLAVPAALLHSS